MNKCQGNFKMLEDNGNAIQNQKALGVNWLI